MRTKHSRQERKTAHACQLRLRKWMRVGTPCQFGLEALLRCPVRAAGRVRQSWSVWRDHLRVALPKRRPPFGGVDWPGLRTRSDRIRRRRSPPGVRTPIALRNNQDRGQVQTERESYLDRQ